MTATAKTSLALVLVLCVAACAATTAYGKDPRQLGPDSYVFTVYFNSFASPADAERKAKQYVTEFMPKHGYTSYEITNRLCEPDRGKCEFRVDFKK